MDTKLIFLDIDKTQIKTSSQKVEAHAELPYSYVLKDLVERQGLPLVHCSGRSLPHITRDIFKRQSGLTTPHLAHTKAIIANVGTEIYIWNPKFQTYDQCSDYIEPAARSLFTKNAAAIKQSLSEIPSLEIQDASHLGPFKISFWGKEGCVLETAMNDARDQLAAIGLSEKDITLTGSDQGRLAVEVTPLGANKGAAVLYVARKFGVETSNVFVGGDSMNDHSMLNLPDVKVILPANAQKELVEILEKTKSGEMYVSDKRFAEGILDGLTHYGVLKSMPEIPYQYQSLKSWRPAHQGQPPLIVRFKGEPTSPDAGSM